MRILPEETSCIVIDYQEKILPAMANREELLKNSVTLLKGLRELEIPMLLTTQYSKGLGLNVPQITEAIGSDAYIDKKTFSAYGVPEVREWLEKSENRKNVIICGIEAHVCVLQTIMDLSEAGYQPVLVEDCVSSRNPHDMEMAVKRAAVEGALITTKEALLFELTQGAGTTHFKQISALIK